MVVNNESLSDFGYSLSAECVASKTINVKKFQSSRTGITLITANVPGPLVHGFFVVGKLFLFLRETNDAGPFDFCNCVFSFYRFSNL